MVTKGTESSQGNGDSPPPQITTPAGPPPGPPPGPHDQRSSRAGNAVFKSGPLFISSKGIGWTSWKKRWFILTHTSLVFFRSDPSAIPQKGSEVNLILGGIDLNNSGSVVVKADKKLLTVQFPNGRDGRAFTLKAETLEDLYEWKTALENALIQAPSTAVMGQNGILKNDQAEATNDSVDQSNNKPVKFTVIGRPILLALEDVDGTPSFLEKALRFIEEHGVKVEGVLRQAADVDDVERRIREFEKGKTEFSPGEDAHVVADCIKYVIRELPSSPVPASCCNALLEARRTERGARVNAIRTAICETFPEPNRRLLQRILMMMQAVASHKTMNRMSTSAVAACMAPLLLRPLLSGECEIESDFDVGCDGSAQLLQAAAAANFAQAIVITLLEEYHNIFGEGSMSPGLYSDSEESGIGTEEGTDDEESYEDDENDNATQGSDASTDDDLENASSGSCSESDGSEGGDLDENDFSSGSKSPETGDKSGVSQTFSSAQHDDIKKSEDIPDQSKNNLATQANESAELLGNISTKTIPDDMLNSHGRVLCMQKSSSMSKGPPQCIRPRAANWGRTGARKNLSMESIDYPIEEEAEIQRLEANKADLQNRIANEVKGNEILQSSLEKRKRDLHERRLALEKDVARLQDQLQNERDKKMAMEAVLNSSQGPFCFPATIDEKTKVELEEIVQAESNVFNLKQKVDDLGLQLNQQIQKNCGPTGDSSNQLQQMSAKLKDKQRDTQTATTSYVSERKDNQRDNQTAATSYVSERKDKQRDTQTSATSYVSEGSTNKDSCPDELVVTENEKRRESTPDKNPPQNQQLDSIHHSSSRPSNSKKSGSKVEGGNSTSSALTKLTNRLNFLKERRSQITSELQNLDKNRGSGQAGRRQDKGRGAEQQHSEGAEGRQSTEKGRERDGFQSQQNMDKGPGMEGQSLENPSKLRKSNGHTPQNIEGDRRPEGHRQHSFERRAEGHLNYDGDRSRGAGGHSSRTLSR